MAPRKVTDLSTEEQQQVVNSELPISRAVTGTISAGTTPDGRQISIGVMDTSRPQASLAGRAVDVQFDNMKESMIQRHEATGIEPATVLNFSPIPLVINSPMETLKVRIPKAPDLGTPGGDFSFHVITDAAIELRYLGEKMNAPHDYMPIQVARAFEEEYRHQGGVVAIKGLPTAENLAKPFNRELIALARDTMKTWMFGMFNEAQAFWNSPAHVHGKNIVEIHRACALHLKALGYIDDLPEWTQENRTVDQTMNKCPVCLTVAKPGVSLCQNANCNHILDPAAAYIAGAIEEDHASLERLTRKEVTDLGISAYVAETIDEKPERLKRGDPRPMSLAQQRAIEGSVVSQPVPEQPEPKSNQAAI